MPIQNYLAFAQRQSDELGDPIHLERSSTVPVKQNKTRGRKKIVRDRQPPLSKKGRLVQLLQASDGATLQDLMAASGWQAHSVRGFLSGVLGKRMGMKLISEARDDGQRVYRDRMMRIRRIWAENFTRPSFMPVISEPVSSMSCSIRTVEILPKRNCLF